MPRALRSLSLLLIVLALAAVAATASTGSRTPRMQDMQPQQLQAQGNGVASLDGGFAVVGWLTQSRRTGLRLVDRFGDAKLTLNGREIVFGRRRVIRLQGIGGRYLVTGTRFTIEVRGAQGLEASGVGWARFQGRGQYRVADGDSGPWNGPRMLIGVTPDGGGGGGDDGGDDRVRAFGGDAPAPVPAPAPEPAPAPAGAAG